MEDVCHWGLQASTLSAAGGPWVIGVVFMWGGEGLGWAPVLAECPAVDTKFSCDHRVANSLGVGSEQPRDWFFLVCVYKVFQVLIILYFC